MKVGVPVASPTPPAPKLDDAAQAAFRAKAQALARPYRTRKEEVRRAPPLREIRHRGAKVLPGRAAFTEETAGPE